MAGQVGQVWGGIKIAAKVALMAGLVIGLSACGTAGRRPSQANAQNVGPCPLMGVLYDAGRLVEIKGPEEAFANVGYTAEMRGVSGFCRYVGADPIVMNLDIDMAFGRGPKAEGDTHTYKYWVAVSRRDVAPLAKEYFTVDVNFPRGADRVSKVEKIEKITIPRANKDTSGVNFEILVGFDLTPEQLAFNRAGKRFRVTAGSAR
jgi:hypothetical protein